MLEEIANRVEPVFRSQAMYAWAHKKREAQRPDTGRPNPPPRTQAVLISQAGGTDRRAGTDIGGHDGREQETGTQ